MYNIYIGLDWLILDGMYIVIGCEINVAVCCFLTDIFSNVRSIWTTVVV